GCSVWVWICDHRIAGALIWLVVNGRRDHPFTAKRGEMSMFFPQVLYFAKYTKVERVVPNALANVIVFGEADPPLNHRCKGGTRCPLLSVEAAVSAATPRTSQAKRLPRPKPRNIDSSHSVTQAPRLQH